MPIDVKRFHAAGIDRIHWGRLNANSLFTGQVASLAATEDSGVGRLHAGIAFPYEVPEPERIVVPGDNTIQGVYQFESDDPSAFILETGVQDLFTAAAAQGVDVEALGDWQLSQLRPNPRTFANILLMLLSPATSREAGSDGLGGFHVAVLTNCQLMALGAGAANTKQTKTYRWGVTVNPTSKRPYGALLSAIPGAAEMEDGFEFFAANRVALHAYQDNGSEGAESFTLDYKPAGDHTTDKVKAWKDGVPTAVTGVNVETKQVTVTAGATPALWVVMYEYVLA